MHNPLVSIVIPVYNGSNYMREAIDSALAQTYQNIEVIVINDGSKDDGATDAIARSYGDRIRYYPKENGGVSSALNMGIQKMRGEYFSWLSHDDAYEPDKIEKQVEALRNADRPERTVVCCAYLHMDANSKPLSGMNPRTPFRQGRAYTSDEVLTQLLKKATFNGCCLLIPRGAFEECGLFDEQIRFCQDALMWYRIFMKDHSLRYIDAVCVRNRVHAGQLTQTGQSLFRKECQEISNSLAEEFRQISTQEHNYLRMYLMSDARHFSFGRVMDIIQNGKKHHLLSGTDTVKALAVCGYGHIRPFIRKAYYAIFRRIKTA